MAKQLSTDAIDTLRHLDAMQTGEVAPPLAPVVVAELLSAGLVAKAARRRGCGEARAGNAHLIDPAIQRAVPCQMNIRRSPSGSGNTIGLSGR